MNAPTIHGENRSLKKARGRAALVRCPGDPQDRLPGAHGLKIFQPRKAENQISNTLPAGGRPCDAPRKRENSRQRRTVSTSLLEEAPNPTAGLGSKKSGRGPEAIESNSLTLNLLKSRPSLGHSVYKSPEPDVIHEPQHQKHRYNIRSAGTHQRQRNARDRHPSHHHSDIHQHVKQQ
jgi:hypothetical protein